MVVPVIPSLPDSTLSPHQVNQKFHSSAMAGLGCFWNTDNAGDEFYDCSDDTPGSAPINWGSTATQPDGTLWPFDPALKTTQPSLDHMYYDGGGDLVAVLSDGSTYTVQPGGHVAQGGGGTPSYGTVTQKQSSAWPALIQSLVNAGVRVGTVANLPAGASLTPNGTIVGSGQSLIAPGVITGNSLTSALSALTNSPMLMIGGFGILALLLFSGGRR